MHIIKKTLLCCFLFFVLQSAAQTTVDSVPNQKLINGSYVSDPDGIFRFPTVDILDTLLASLEQQTTVQVAVVALQSIGDKDIFTFTQELFNQWGVGDKTKNNGLMILLVKDQRTVRFHTGYGLEGILPDIICKNIQMDYMVPLFKQEMYDEGMVAGVQEVARVIRNPVYAQELTGIGGSETESSSKITVAGVFFSYAVTLIPLLIVFFFKLANKGFVKQGSSEHNTNPMKTTAVIWLLKYMFLPLALLLICVVLNVGPALLMAALLYLYYIIVIAIRFKNMQQLLNQNTKQEAFSENIAFIKKQQTYLWMFAILFPLPFLPALIYYLRRRTYYRNHPRSCSECKNMMHKLNEAEDDKWLTDKQKMEETVESVDYDVWECGNCHATQQFIFPNRFTKYSSCPECKAKTYYMASDITIVNATYHSAGKGEKTYQCQFCSRKVKQNYTIPMLTHSSSSSSSSFGSSSSSSSSGGSWGGGSSGGGGASSSW